MQDTPPAIDPSSDLEHWLDSRNQGGDAYHGEPCSIEVVVKGDARGTGFTYHVDLLDGSPPQFRSGPAPEAVASLELNRADVDAELAGRHPVVGFMRGTTKTKGATRPLYEFFRLLG
jgi:hypothetical protein